MKTIVFGRTGQVATELAKLPGVETLGRDVADFADPDAVSRAARSVDADAFINAAAFTDVDGAEDAEPLALRINGDSPGALAQVAREREIPLVHISTDYVFDGSGDRPWMPDDTPNPISAYGRSKLAGEDSVARAGGVHAILRTSWVFSGHGRNFVHTMLDKGRTKRTLNVVDDQIGGPTAARDIARACHTVARRLTEAPDLRGIYHFAGAPDQSWAGFAEAIFQRAGMSVSVRRVGTDAFKTKARRPLNCRLDCTSTARAFGLHRPDWRLALDEAVIELMAADDGGEADLRASRSA